jgi:hypothetical protein
MDLAIMMTICTASIAEHAIITQICMKYLGHGFVRTVMKCTPLPVSVAESVIQTMSNDIAKSLRVSYAMIVIAKKKESWRENKGIEKKLYCLL